LFDLWSPAASFFHGLAVTEPHDLLNPKYCFRKGDEYRAKASKQTPGPLKAALEAVAKEYDRRAKRHPALRLLKAPNYE
jgi:hypothetical protein